MKDSLKPNDLRTIKDVSEYVNGCLALAEGDRYKRYEAAGWIVGLGKLDIVDAWRGECPEFLRLFNLASRAEVSDSAADDYWLELLTAAIRLAVVAAQT